MSVAQPVSNSLPEPSKSYRWIVLVVVSIAMAGNYYTYDSINPLERILTDQLNFSASQFGWLNASYSLAAVCTLLIGEFSLTALDCARLCFCFLLSALWAQS